MKWFQIHGGDPGWAALLIFLVIGLGLWLLCVVLPWLLLAMATIGFGLILFILHLLGVGS